MKTYIYILIDPRNFGIKYVGKTVEPHKRYRNRFSKNESGGRKGKWLSRLRTLGMNPIMQIVEEVLDGKDWAEAERWWIKHLLEQGYDLCNLSNGGEGEAGRVLSEESRQKLSASLKGHPVSSETREKLKATAIAQWNALTPEQQEAQKNLSKGRPQTLEEKTKQIAAQKGHPCSQETREKIRTKNKLHIISEEQKAQISATLKAKYAVGALPKTEKQIEQLKTFRRKTYTPWTDEQKAKHSEILKARLALLTPEQKYARMQKALAARGCA